MSLDARDRLLTAVGLGDNPQLLAQIQSAPSPSLRLTPPRPGQALASFQSVRRAPPTLVPASPEPEAKAALTADLNAAAATAVGSALLAGSAPRPNTMAASASTPTVVSPTAAVATRTLSTTASVPLLSTPAASKSDPLLDQLETELRVVTESLGLKPYQPPIPSVRVAAASASASASASATATTTSSAVLPQQPVSPLLSPSSASLKQDLAALSADLKTEMATISNSDATSVRASLSRQFSV
jgi:hypothetical protein